MNANGKIVDFETPSGKAKGNGDDALEDLSLNGGDIVDNKDLVDDKDLRETGEPAAAPSAARAKDALGDASRRLPAGKNQR
jgi:hypothetical protein